MEKIILLPVTLHPAIGVQPTSTHALTRPTRLIWVLRLIILLLPPVIPVLANSTPPQATEGKSNTCFNLREGGFGPGLNHYEKAIFTLAARVDEHTLGPCPLTTTQNAYSMARVWKEFSNGEKFHGGLSSGYPPEQDKTHLIAIEHPFLGASLGLRQSIVTTEFKSQYEKLSSYDEFRQLRVGQGRQWIDLDVYQAMKIPTVGSFRLEQAFGMLKQGRFDHLPLCVLQTQAVFDSIKQEHPDMVIANHTYIYYPLKTWVYLNTKDKSRLQRFSKGFEKIFADGSADALFTRLFGEHIRAIKNANGRIFVLQNPAYSKEENIRLTRAFLDLHELNSYAIFPDQNYLTPALEQSMPAVLRSQ